MKSYLTSTSRQRVFLVCGPVGSGKTCLMAKVANLTGRKSDFNDIVMKSQLQYFHGLMDQYSVSL